MMELLYAQEHLSCFHYDKLDDPIVNYIETEKEEQKKYISNKNVIFLTLEGSMLISFGTVFKKKIKGGDIFLLPADNELICIMEPYTKVLLLRLPVVFSFCDHFSLEMLYNESKNPQMQITTNQILKINERIEAYLHDLLSCWKDGLRCQSYLDLKIKEFFFLLRAYTSKEDLIAFFAPILSDNTEFYNLVQSKYKSVKTVKEFAQLTNYSLTGFERKFRSVFGISAHQWMKEQLSSNLYHEIRCTNKTFLEISDQFNFSSSAHLSSFCKSVFGLTPKSIRRGETKEMREDDEPLSKVEISMENIGEHEL